MARTRDKYPHPIIALPFSEWKMDYQVLPINEQSFNQLYTHILSKNRLRSLKHKKQDKKLHISTLNGGVDLYTLKPIDPNDTNNHIDHIFELQCFAYIVASALHNIDKFDDNGQQIFSKIRNQLVKVINADFNLNITDKTINLVKMNIFKTFLRLLRTDSHCTLRSLLDNCNSFTPNIDVFYCCLKDVCQKIKIKLQEYIGNINCNNPSLHIIKSVFIKILNEFCVFCHLMKIE